MNLENNKNAQNGEHIYKYFRPQLPTQNSNVYNVSNKINELELVRTGEVTSLPNVNPTSRLAIEQKNARNEYKLQLESLAWKDFEYQMNQKNKRNSRPTESIYEIAKAQETIALNTQNAKKLEEMQNNANAAKNA